MGNENINLTVEIKKAVKEVSKELINGTVDETVKKLRENRLLKNQLPYTKRVETILYNYNNLRQAVVQKHEDIEYIKRNGLPEASGSIVIYTPGSGTSKQDRYVELMEKYKRDIIETERDLVRIDNALDKVKKDKYYKIIELKYLNPTTDIVTDEMLGETFKVDRRTINRNRYKLINKLVTILFPESIKELM